MLKRLIGIITVKDGWAVQSIGYKKYLPLGRPEILAENLDRWHLEEILIVDISRSAFKTPNIDLVNSVASMSLSTPISYAGGINTAKHAIDVIKAGADRIGIENIFRDNYTEVQEITNSLGRQAIIRIQPLQVNGKKLQTYNYSDKSTKELDDIGYFLESSNLYSELMIVDYKNEGIKNGFNLELLNYFQKSNIQLICFGGISNSKQIRYLSKIQNISAIAIGNFLNFSELANREIGIKRNIKKLRHVSYGSKTLGEKDW
jgi:cyclase